MGYSRYDRGREPRGSRGWDEDRRIQSKRDERGFFERAGDEVSSWFGDEEAQRRREMDERGYRESQGGRPMARDDDSFERGARNRDEDYRRPYAGRSGPQRLGDDSYRPMTGDYGLSSGSEPLHSMEREYGRRDLEQHRYDRGSSQRHPTMQRDMSGAGLHDPHYSEWRNRQISELDRDYDEYRRENQSRFESDFSNWRNTRQAKRQMLGSIRENMSVVGADEQPLGTVDKVRRDRIILTKSDSPDGQHHSISCGMIDRVEGDRVILEKPAEEARQLWGSEVRDRALFEREDDGEPGAHILNRSFSGTY
jgi:hypothetical protein